MCKCENVKMLKCENVRMTCQTGFAPPDLSCVELKHNRHIENNSQAHRD